MANMQWYMNRLIAGGFSPADPADWEDPVKSAPYVRYTFAHYLEHVAVVWEHRHALVEAGKKYNVDPYYLAAVITVEQVDMPPQRLKPKVKLISPALAKITPDIKVPEKVTDFVGGILTGKTSVGLGQVAIQTVRKLNLLGMKDWGNVSITLALSSPETNIHALADYSSRVATELVGDGPRPWESRAFILQMGSRQTSSFVGVASFWGEEIYNTMVAFRVALPLEG